MVSRSDSYPYALRRQQVARGGRRQDRKVKIRRANASVSSSYVGEDWAAGLAFASVNVTDLQSDTGHNKDANRGEARVGQKKSGGNARGQIDRVRNRYVLVG